MEILTDTYGIQEPKYVHMASLGSTTLAAIESFNGYGFACTEGIVKFPLTPTKYYQWAVLPKVNPPTPAVPSIIRVPKLDYDIFSNRKLRIQVFNIPFSIWLSSAPILPSDVGHTKDISYRKLNVVQLLVGRHKIVVIRCGVLKKVDEYRDSAVCNPYSLQKFTTNLR